MKDKPGATPLSLVIQFILVLIITPFIPLMVTFRWAWWEAWVFGAISVLGFIMSRGLAVKKHPDIIRERITSLSRKDVKSWDKILAPAMGFGGVAIPLIAGLDARFGWSGEFGFPIKMIFLVIIVLGYALASYAMITNKFFSGTVRIQTDRGHSVCSDGPYAWIRHPGYTSALLVYLGVPVFLDSPWGFIPVGVLAIVTVIRTYLEDKTLQNELEGYKEFTKKTKYRLIPFIW